MKGWIKLHRKLMNSDIFQNEKLLKIFIYCVLKASHQERNTIVGLQEVTLKQGQFIFGRNKAAGELNMKESTVWKYMKLLEKVKTISLKSNNKFTIVTIEKWEDYQGFDDDEEQQSNNKVTTKEQQSNTNKNVKNVKEDIYTVFEHWKSKGIIIHREMTKKMESHINARLENYDLDVLLKAIDNYNEVLTNDLYYWSYKWTLEDFMKPNNVIRFTDEAEPFKAFLNNKKASQPKKRISKGDFDLND